MTIEILYEDSDVLVINKPFGVVVNRAESIKNETIQDWVEGKYFLKDMAQKPADKIFFDRSGVCHRLDKETSGCLMIAKNPKTLKYFLGQFKSRKIQKTYTALVHGWVAPREGEVVLPIKRSMFDREKRQVHYDGKRSVTIWKVVKYFDYSNLLENWKKTLTLLDLDLKTGRTHQIRVHMSFLGWPIFADEKYLNKSQFAQDTSLLQHHFLHARKIEFKNENGSVISVEAPLPQDCSDLLDKLETKNP